ncbi:MAG: lipoyl synthase [Deltaproteobacteria bacterium]|nr:lipoyl synthase [Deltaproteobacteria bacterium]
MTSAAPLWLLEEIRRARRGEGRERMAATQRVVSAHGLSTVCESARCPNRGECFSVRTATFLILGEVCTRGCAFCAVAHGKPEPPREDEPERLARAVEELGLDHVVVTSVTRDDLPDGGADHFARVVAALRRDCPGVTVELLVPDFAGSDEALAAVVTARPDVLAHNIETVPRLYPRVRRGAGYERSLGLLRRSKELDGRLPTKSGLMLGLGETAEEVEATLANLAGARCDLLTLGQYLSPSPLHAPVERYVEPEEFDTWRAKAEAMGFRSVAAAALVRSSYKAPLFFEALA